MDQFTVIAEIAAVFLGFAAVVTAVGNPAHSHSKIALKTIVDVVLIGALALFAALLPVALVNFQVSDLLVWRISGSTIFIVNLCLLAILKINASSDSDANSKLNKVVKAFFYIMEIVFQLCILLCALSLWDLPYAAIYFVALMVMIVQVALLLAYTVLATLNYESRDI